MKYQANHISFVPSELALDHARTLFDVFDRFVTPCGALLGSRELLTRTDTKFVLPTRNLDQVLAGVTRDYAALRVESGALATYDSRYFDTLSLKCFHDHRRGRRPRYKIRIRHYPDRRLSYLEVKTKRNETVTDKQRLAILFGCNELSEPHLEFLHTHIGDTAYSLRPTIDIRFRRVTLLGITSNERVTIDLAVETRGQSEVASRLGRLAIVEVKQSPFCVRTPIMRALQQHGARPKPMSKYVAAMSIVRPQLAFNRLLPDLRRIERMNRRG